MGVLFTRLGHCLKDSLCSCIRDKMYVETYILILFLQFDGVFVVSGSLDTSIRVWDAETGTIAPFQHEHRTLRLD